MFQKQHAGGETVSATDHVLHEQDMNLFLSLRGAFEGTVTASGVRAAIEHMAGLDIAADQRLAGLRSALAKLPENTPLTGAEFERLVRNGGRLAYRAIRGELVVPDFHVFRSEVSELFESISRVDPVGAPPGAPQAPPRLAVFDKDYEIAKNADYIPSLSSVQDGWGVAICTVDGQTLSLGDHDVPFSIQSCCKPVNYCQSLEMFNRGEDGGIEGGGESPEDKAVRKRRRQAARKLAESDAEVEMAESRLGVHDFVDCEPSGAPFNGLSWNQFGMPANPLINAGAIMISALVSRARATDVSMKEIQEVWRRLAGMKVRPGYDPETAGGEERTGSRNKAIVELLDGNEAFPCGVNDKDKRRQVLDFYFNSCSLTLNANQMAMAAATLANRGVCPVTGDRVFRSSTVTNGLAAMLHCGMYDAAGKFGRLVGLPAKSGVGGGILLVVPGVMGICTFSPRLDKIGNSLRGLRFFERLLERYALHMLELPSVLGDRKLDIRVSHLRSTTQAIQEVVSAASLGDVDTIRQFEHDAGSPMAYLELLQAPDYDGRTPLHLAAAEGHDAIVSYLLLKGVNPQPLDRWGQTPLSDARRGASAGVVELLERALAAGHPSAQRTPAPIVIDAARRDKAWRTLAGSAPTRATTSQQLEVIWAAAEGDLVTLRRHVARGTNLHTRDYDDRTPLHLATAQGYVEVVGFLTNYYRESVASSLSDAGAGRVSWPDRWGRTALDEAEDPRVLPSGARSEATIRSQLPACAGLLRGVGATTGQALPSPAHEPREGS